MADALNHENLSQVIAQAVAAALDSREPISHGVAREIATRFAPQGRAPQGRRVYRKALQSFIASGVMKSINTTPPRWVPHGSATVNPADAVWQAISGEGQWHRVSDGDREAIAALGDYLTYRQQAGELGPVPGWSDIPV